jgi:hypothetical protein
MTTGAGDFELTLEEPRAAACYVAESAQEVVPVFEEGFLAILDLVQPWTLPGSS